MAPLSDRVASTLPADRAGWPDGSNKYNTAGVPDVVRRLTRNPPASSGTRRRNRSTPPASSVRLVAKGCARMHGTTTVLASRNTGPAVVSVAERAHTLPTYTPGAVSL